MVFMGYLGIKVYGRVFGILIDSRNKFSLSRLQIVLWTLLLMSSIFLFGVLKGGNLDIVVDPALWALMGISVGSTASAVMIKGTKAARNPNTEQWNILKSGSGDVNHLGLLHVNEAIDQARFIDMFKGEEISDFAYLDVSKVQMFVFTIAIWLAYLSSIIGFVAEKNYSSLPIISDSLVVLLGISHAGYLTVKASVKS
ncbi:MAG: hypothetical protein COA43_14130 [Robiginitomaculum sp.]|nr:MAG: hypothetical protein COA43_14130 [Robiginitomaculum sp.]